MRKKMVVISGDPGTVNSNRQHGQVVSVDQTRSKLMQRDGLWDACWLCHLFILEKKICGKNLQLIHSLGDLLFASARHLYTFHEDRIQLASPVQCGPESDQHNIGRYPPFGGR